VRRLRGDKRKIERTRTACMGVLTVRVNRYGRNTVGIRGMARGKGKNR
jgi:hypothetical protein